MLKRFRNMKIGLKAALGFGTLILVFLAMGILVIAKIETVRKGTETLAHAYVPEVDVANNIERNYLLTVLEMRGYALSNEDDEAYLKKSNEYLAEVKKYLAEARKLGDNHPELATLREKIGEAEKAVKEYEEFAVKTVQVKDAIAGDLKILDVAAASYMKNAQDFLRNQYASMREEINAGADKFALLERLEKIQSLEDIVTVGNIIRTMNFKSQALDNPQIMKEGLANFTKIEEYSAKIRPMIRKAENVKNIENIKTSAEAYRQAMSDVLKNRLELLELSGKRIASANKVIDIAKQTSSDSMKQMINVTDNAIFSLSRVSAAILIGFVCVMLIALGLALLMTLPLKKAVAKFSYFTAKFGNGDLTSKIDINSGDELGLMASDLNRAVANLSNIMQELSDTTNILSSSSEELSAVSEQMASSSEEMNSQANMVAAAAEQINVSVDLVAAALEQSGNSLSEIAGVAEHISSVFSNVAELGKKTSDHVKGIAKSSEDISVQISTVASASEEMTSSLNEVAKHTSQASRISQDASRRTEEINIRMNALVASSKRIGRIVEMIKDIADQTNMLALNATIEAAGAGDAGRGFAVVAGEIKELAKQSAEATDEISDQIAEIQTSTNDVVQSVEEISKVIVTIADINEMIAASVEEQTATASEISKSVASTAVTVKHVAASAGESAELVGNIAGTTQETSKTVTDMSKDIDELLNGVKEIVRSSREASNGVNEISKNIQGVSIASKQTALGASQTSEASVNLAEMASGLAKIASRFKLSEN